MQSLKLDCNFYDPNLTSDFGAISSTTSSTLSTTLSRKNHHPKRSIREVCDGELKELLCDLFLHVRIPHILPRDRTSEVLDMAIARNLFPFHPNFASQGSSSTKFAPWDPRNPPNVFIRPRLFLPYFEECKVCTVMAWDCGMWVLCY